MPQSEKLLEVQFDKNWEVQDLRSDDEFAKTATEFIGAVNNGSEVFPTMFYEQDESECREAFHENFHAGYKRDSEHR